MKLCVLSLLALSCAGCVMGIPDADPPVPPVKPCQVWIVLEPDHVASCVTRDEFDRAMKGVLY